MYAPLTLSSSSQLLEPLNTLQQGAREGVLLVTDDVVDGVTGGHQLGEEAAKVLDNNINQLHRHTAVKSDQSPTF